MIFCIYCEEEILPFEAVAPDRESLHFECSLRMIVGSVAHQQERCWCFGGNGDDEEIFSVRQNARLAAVYFLEGQAQPPKLITCQRFG